MRKFIVRFATLIYSYLIFKLISLKPLGLFVFIEIVSVKPKIKGVIFLNYVS